MPVTDQRGTESLVLRESGLQHGHHLGETTRLNAGAQQSRKIRLNRRSDGLETCRRWIYSSAVEVTNESQHADAERDVKRGSVGRVRQSRQERGEIVEVRHAV